jgi:hypothetical protein
MTRRDRIHYRSSGDWALERRAALSHAAEQVAVPAGLHAAVHGPVTTVNQHGVDTRSEHARLRGSGRRPVLGAIRVAGVLNSNFVDVIRFPDQGTLTLTSARRPGSLTLSLSGPPSDLAPINRQTTRLTFTVSKATGELASFLGAQGTADLILVTKSSTPLNPSLMSKSRGTFTLVLTVA